MKESMMKDSASYRRIPKPLDGGYGWVIVTSSFLLQAISGGIAFSVGVFFVEFLEAFKDTTGKTAWIGSINTGLLFGAGPLASILANKWGHRVVVILGGFLSSLGLLASAFAENVYTLYATYGVITGLGFCFTYVPSVVIVGLYFDKRRNLAMGLGSAGFACGNFIFAPIMRFLIITFGWRGGLIMCSGICLNCCVLGALLSPLKLWSRGYSVGPKISEKEGESIFNLSLLKDASFVIFLCNNVLWNIGSLILLVICTDYAYKLGMQKSQGAILISVIGLCSLVGRLLVAVLANHKRCNRFLIFIASTAVSGVAIGLFPVAKTFALMVFFSALYGLFFGTQLGVLAVVTAELFGVARLTSAYGYLMFGNGAGAMLGPPIAGWMYDLTLRYEISFYLGGGVTVLSAAILVCIPILQRRNKSTATLTPLPETEVKLCDADC